MNPQDFEENEQSIEEPEHADILTKKTWAKPVIENIISVDRTEMGFFGNIHPEDGVYSGS